jgi:2-methylisocitrate lyase-like PEP mutase family enzyme
MAQAGLDDPAPGPGACMPPGEGWRRLPGGNFGRSGPPPEGHSTNRLDGEVAIPPAVPDPVGQDGGMDFDGRRARFRALHESGTFLIPNPHDIGSCRLLASLGFPALATTSGGFAASLGRMDMTVGRDELVDHTGALVSSTDLPISVDAEQCFPGQPGGVVTTVALLAEAGAAGCSLEDWDPAAGRIEDIDVAVERIGAASAEADRHGMVLTARAENHLREVDDLDDTIGRLRAYREAGAHVVYAPGLTDLRSIARVVRETGAPVNVLLTPGGPSREELGSVGVRRLSVGSSLARIAYGALVQAAQDLRDAGALREAWPYLDRGRAQAAFASPKT